MYGGITRRDFLKLALLGGVAPFLPGIEDAVRHEDEPGGPQWGRVLAWGATVLDKAAPDGNVLKSCSLDDIVRITASVEAPGLNGHNDLWYETRNGYIFSAFVQPVEYYPQPVVRSIPAGGFWAEVAMPYADARLTPGSRWVATRLYYSSVYRVTQLASAPDGTAMYGLAEGEVLDPAFFAPARALRRLLSDDLAPLSPGADKYIRISLGRQTLEAYEGTRLVLSARTATGLVFHIDGKVLDDTTPVGRFRVVRKDLADHMTGGTKGKADYYDLPGVPFCTYFTDTGVAVHGAYWHHDFGTPRSHGCVNVAPDVARWVYRWTEPGVPYDAWQTPTPDKGTVIEVVST